MLFRSALPEDLAGKMFVIVGQAHDGQRGDGLTATGLAHQAHGLTRTDVKVDMVDDERITRAEIEQKSADEFINGLAFSKGIFILCSLYEVSCVSYYHIRNFKDITALTSPQTST